LNHGYAHLADMSLRVYGTYINGQECDTLLSALF